MPAWRRRALIALAVLAVLAAAAAIALPAMLRAEIVRQAAARGIELDPGEIEVGMRALRFKGVSFTLAGVRGLSGSAARVTVRIEGLAPVGVEAESVAIGLVGAGVAAELAAWGAAHGARAHELPAEVRGLRAGYRDRAGGAELGALLAGSLRASPRGAGARGAGGVLRGARAILRGREVARTEAAWSFGSAGVSLGVGAAEIAAAPLRIDLRTEPAPAITARLAPAPVAVIAAPFGVDPRLPGVTAGGTVELRLPAASAAPGAPAAALVEGSAALTLAGYVPPHPRELDGILFGHATEVRVRAKLSPDLSHVALDDVSVSAGALALRGKGSIQLTGADPELRVDLSGAVPCAALAGSAAGAHLGAPLGRLAGDLARQALGGSVAVRVAAHARASRLDAPRIERSAQINCRLGR